MELLNEENVRRIRGEQINRWIQTRKDDGEQFYNCVFSISVPKTVFILEDEEAIKKVVKILENNNVSYQKVDTVPGSWNLNRDWLETAPMKCIVEYCGVYPIDWNIDDVVAFEEMETCGEIIVNVMWVMENGDCEPNH